ncbi:DUF5716 family protein [Mycoplasmatota bacterium WC44]
MNIFDVLPHNFFALLTSKNKDIYSKSLKLILDKTQSEVTFSYAKSELIYDIVELLENEKTNDFDEIENVVTKSHKEKAHVIVRKLKECGWIMEGLNTDYSRTIFISNHALPFINAIDNIYENTRVVVTFEDDDSKAEYTYSTKVEIDGYAYSIYSILNNNSKLKKSTVLLQVSENTKMLMDSLKQLNYKIKSYSDSVKILTSIDEAIKDFFTEYTREVLYKNYHRIKTLDNISKFRNKIINMLTSKLRSSTYIKEVASEFITADYYETEAVALEKVKEMLHYCIDSIQNIDEIVKAIEAENYMYTNIILKKTKFIISNYDDVEGYLKSILKKIVSEVNEDEEYSLPNSFENLFSMYTTNYIDNESLYRPRKSRSIFKQSRIALDMSENTLENVELLEKIKGSSHSLKSINKHVTELLSGKSEIVIEDIPLNKISDFISLIYVIIYSSKSDQYSLKYFDDDIKVNGVRFKRFLVRGNI